MTEEHKIQLQQKKQVQLKQKILSWFPYWLPIFNAVIELKKSCSFEYFECVKPTDYLFLDAAVKQMKLGKNIPSESIKISEHYYVHDKMKEHYPSNLAMRYLPTLSHPEVYETDTALMLAKAAETLFIKHEEEVFLFYTKFTPVLRVPFSSIALVKEEEIMHPEDLCIMAIDGSWLIFRSLENEWTWGYRNS
ncbi:MAG: hypothetical protein H7296_02910 [Bacteroidia bacterium]|nr:hypothetical protein [Bacteroidia bacterium]